MYSHELYVNTKERTGYTPVIPMMSLMMVVMMICIPPMICDNIMMQGSTR